MRSTPRERLLARSVRTPNGCREWQGCKDKDGYGLISVDGRNRRAHRVAYETVRGPIPDGAILDHVVCDNPACCDEWHVEQSTHAENVLRGSGISATHARRTHCAQGHPLSGENLRVHTYADGRKKRICRTCARLRARKVS